MTPWQRIADAIAEMARGPFWQVKIKHYYPDDNELPGLTTTMAFRARNLSAAIHRAAQETMSSAEPGWVRADVSLSRG